MKRAHIRAGLLASIAVLAAGWFVRGYLQHRQRNEPLDRFAERAAETVVAGNARELASIMTTPEREYIGDSASVAKLLEWAADVRSTWHVAGKAAFTGRPDGVAASLVVPVARSGKPPFDLVLDIYRTEDGPKVLVTYSLATSYALDRYGSEFPSASENERLMRCLHRLLRDHQDALSATGVPGVVTVSSKGLERTSWAELAAFVDRRMARMPKTQ